MTFAGYDVASLARLPLSQLRDVLEPTAELDEATAAMESFDSGERTEVAVTIACDLVARLDVLVELGLGYLSLHRSAPTLSAGETQRLRLATQLRSGLFGVVYVLDEPSAGLHPADAEPLIDLLAQLKSAGNSLFVVEHDMDVVRREDWLVEVGPGAGEAGGRVLYSGPVDGLAATRGSPTASALFAERSRLRDEVREPCGWLHLHHVTRHNLDDVEADFPLGVFTAVTGVSKSTLVTQVLAAVVAGHLGTDDTADDDPDVEIENAADAATGVVAHGLESFDRLVRVDHRPIGRTPRSNLATYTGMFDHVRKLFASTPAARRRGYTASRFSFNVAEGRCARAGARGSSRSSCSSCPARMRPARPATGRATTTARSPSPGESSPSRRSSR